MESVIEYACTHADSAFWFFFLLLLLAGLNIPISEDLILLSTGAIASSCLSADQHLNLFIWVYAGCCLSAWEAYWIGRYFGPKLYQLPFICRYITPVKIKKLHEIYEKWGVFTFLIARFIPGGFRNAFFMSGGLGRMPFWKFILRDGCACLFSFSIISYIGYYLAQKHESIIHFVKTYDYVTLMIILMIALILSLMFFWRYFFHSKKNSD